MTRELPIRELLGIVYCPTCEQDTMPLSTGLCGFCDTKIAPRDRKLPTLAVADCLCECGRPVPTGRAKHCSESCSDRAAYQMRKLRRQAEAAA